MTGDAGRTALITGAANGIGRAIALELAAQGASLRLMDIDAAALGDVAAQIGAAGGQAQAIVLDLRDRSALRDALQVLDTPVDILVNNVGQTARENASAFHLARPETLDFVLDISLHVAIHCTRGVVGGMRARGRGRIVNIASDAAFGGTPGACDYAAAKAGLIGFTRSLAMELGPCGVTVNAVCPGPTNTRAMQRIPAEMLERARAGIPMGALCEPEDIAHAVAFLASDKARFITGQALLVNGGRVLH